MKVNSLCLMLAALLSGGAYAQAIMEHAAAAAGATVGTAGGKALSNMLDKALNKAADTGTKAAAAAPKPEKQKAPGTAAAPNPGPGAAPGPVVAAPSAAKSAINKPIPRRPRAPQPDKPVFAAAEPGMDPSMAAPAAAMAPPPPSVEDFAKVKEGSARQDVFTALGTPSSHITIPDEGHLIEILTYSDGTRRLGSVRLDNGLVAAVAPAAR